jgi:hypothetical protein
MKHQNLGWVFLAEVLRHPTYLVVTLPTKKYDTSGQNSLGLHGHVGALYIKTKAGAYKPQFKGQAKFHNELRDLLKASLSAARNDEDGYIKALLKHIQEWYWLGDLDAMAKFYNMTAVEFGKLACPYFFNSGKNEYSSWGQTMADMANKLKEGWAISNTVIDNVWKAYKTQYKS